MVRRMAQPVPVDHHARPDFHCEALRHAIPAWAGSAKVSLSKILYRLGYPPSQHAAAAVFELIALAMDLPIQLHELHPQPSAFNAESFLLLEFYSGATRPPGRFSEGFLLRRLHRRSR